MGGYERNLMDRRPKRSPRSVSAAHPWDSRVAVAQVSPVQKRKPSLTQVHADRRKWGGVSAPGLGLLTPGSRSGSSLAPGGSGVKPTSSVRGGLGQAQQVNPRAVPNRCVFSQRGIRTGSREEEGSVHTAPTLKTSALVAPESSQERF